MSEAVKNTGRPDETGSDSQQEARPRGADAMSRIKLALLEQYSRGMEKHGADPYNTTGGGDPGKDKWRGNSRRI
jgi:hypothetical protein